MLICFNLSYLENFFGVFYLFVSCILAQAAMPHATTTTVFSAQFFCNAWCHQRAWAALSASHSDQLLRTGHSTHPYLHYAQIFFCFCCLLSQSERSESFLKLSAEALFGAQRQLVSSGRGCFQAPLSRCIVWGIMACSSFGVSK